MPVEADLTIGGPGRPEVEIDPAGPELPSFDDELVALDDAPHVDESVVKAMLRAIGGGLEYTVGDADVANHWRFTDVELDELTPPLTRIINRRPQLRRAVARGDEAAVAIVLAGYLGRNVAAGRAAKEARDAREREAVEREGDPRTSVEVDGRRPGPWNPDGAGGGHPAGGVLG